MCIRDRPTRKENQHAPRMPINTGKCRNVNGHNERIPNHLPSFIPMLDLVYADNIDDELKEEH
eukprot:5524276-Prorocentrum_lima.AAC.1